MRGYDRRIFVSNWVNGMSVPCFYVHSWFVSAMVRVAKQLVDYTTIYKLNDNVEHMYGYYKYREM